MEELGVTWPSKMMFWRKSMEATQLTGARFQISALQGEAWAAWNASYHEQDRGSYRALGAELYRQAVHERITVNLARLDEQNEWLDRMLGAKRD